MGDFLGGLLIAVIAVCCIPAAIVFMIWIACYGAILVPIACITILAIYSLKKHLNEKGIEIPKTAIPIKAWAPRKPRMIKWQGKEIPLGVFICSIIMSIILLPIIVFTLLFILPPMWSAVIIGFFAAKKAGEYINKERKA